jgi:hypothetical protein
MAYQFELYDRDGASLGDISSVCYDRGRVKLLNGPQVVTGTVPSWHELVNATEADGLPTLAEGYRCLRVRKSGAIVFNGIVWHVEDDGDETTCETRFTAIDPMGAFWPRRVARDADGDFSLPSFMQDFTTGPEIMAEILANSITHEGELGLDVGTAAGGGADVSAAPVDWPMSIGDVYMTLVRTGELDAVITPLDGTGSSGRIMGEVDLYNGDFGTDRTASVVFEYAPGSGVGNVSRFRRTGDMANILNKYYKYLGPKLDEQHYAGNITADDPTLPDPPQTTIESRMNASRSDLSVFFGWDIVDDEYGNELRGLHQRSWQMELWLRSIPRELIAITPSKKGALAPAGYSAFDSSDFDVGDLVAFETTNRARKAASGAVRVYGIPIGIDDDGGETIEDLILSSDAEGL